MSLGPLLEKLWNRSNRVPFLVASASLTAAIALVDWWTRPYISLGFFYLVPILLVVGFLPRPALVAFGVLCAVLSEIFSSLAQEGRAVRLISESLAFGGFGLFVSELLRSRRLQVETEQRLRTLVETSPAAIVTVDERGVIELANQAASELMAPGETSLVGQPIAGFVPELQNALGSGKAQFRASMQCQVRRASGEKVAAEIWFSTFKDKEGPKLAAIIADASEERGQLPGISVHPPEHDGERPRLNDRQLAVLRLVFEGLRNNEIAARLQMTNAAVKNTLQQVFLKTGTNCRSQLVRVALDRYRDLL